MAVKLSLIGQYAMDAYYKEYKGNTGFFELNDFIFKAAATIADYYQRMYDAKYLELRQEKRAKEELVGFDPDILSVQELEIDNSLNGKSEVNLKYPVMSFLSDKSGVGYQFLLPLQPSSGVTLERSSMDELWLYNYIPTTHRIFWRPQNGKLRFYKNALCNIQTVELYYIPSVMNSDGEILGDAMIPDGLMDVAVNKTVATMRGIEQGQVVKMANDGNENKIMETEVNKTALKG